MTRWHSCARPKGGLKASAVVIRAKYGGGIGSRTPALVGQRVCTPQGMKSDPDAVIVTATVHALFMLCLHSSLFSQAQTRNKQR